MARSAYYFGSAGTSFEERLEAVEQVVESTISPDQRALPKALHFGGGTNYVTSPYFPLWYRGADAAPYAATLQTYNQFPVNAMAATLQPKGYDRLVYMRGDAVANQLDIPSLAWNRDHVTGAIVDYPMRAYIDNVDVEFSFSVDWTPDAIEKKRPWKCRVLLIADNEPFVESAINQAGISNEIISPMYTVRDLIAAQPGVDHRYINAIPGIDTSTTSRTTDIKALFPHWTYCMCDLATRSPLRKPISKDTSDALRNHVHSRQFARQYQFGQIADFGVDTYETQAVTTETEAVSLTVGNPNSGTLTTSSYTTPDKPEWPVNTPQEFIFTASARDYSLYKDMTITLQPPDYQRAQGAQRMSPTSSIAIPDSNPLLAATAGVSQIAGGVPSYTGGWGDNTGPQEVTEKYGQNRFLRQNYVFSIKVPIRALQAWSVNQSEDSELRVMNRKFKLVLVHDPTRYWGTMEQDVATGTYSITDTWATQLNAFGAGVVAGTAGFQTAVIERQSVQCPDVNMNVGMVIHFNQKFDKFTKDWPQGSAIQDSVFNNDQVPGSSAAGEAAWRQGNSKGTSTVRFADTPKRQRVG